MTAYAFAVAKCTVDGRFTSPLCTFQRPMSSDRFIVDAAGNCERWRNPANQVMHQVAQLQFDCFTTARQIDHAAFQSLISTDGSRRQVLAPLTRCYVLEIVLLSQREATKFRTFFPELLFRAMSEAEVCGLQLYIRQKACCSVWDAACVGIMVQLQQCTVLWSTVFTVATPLLEGLVEQCIFSIFGTTSINKLS